MDRWLNKGHFLLFPLIFLSQNEDVQEMFCLMLWLHRRYNIYSGKKMDSTDVWVMNKSVLWN